MSAPSESDNSLSEAVRRRRERQERHQREGEGSFAQNLAMIGVLGWTIVTPTLAGIFAGRWLDHRLGSGIFWTGTFLALGLAAGSALAWRRMHD
ncbi:MAG TPA: AtpZ/AtpI family protein [Steroidobacteraceae bacterium]|nr:AtpZ/AtpI family protein [Steroidobacteraceae bacterium]